MSADPGLCMPRPPGWVDEAGPGLTNRRQPLFHESPRGVGFLGRAGPSGNTGAASCLPGSCGKSYHADRHLGGAHLRFGTRVRGMARLERAVSLAEHAGRRPVTG